jgi:hypothetical protein
MTRFKIKRLYTFLKCVPNCCNREQGSNIKNKSSAWTQEGLIKTKVSKMPGDPVQIKPWMTKIPMHLLKYFLGP